MRFIEWLSGFFRTGAKNAPVALPASVSGFRVIAKSRKIGVYGCGHLASLDYKIDLYGEWCRFGQHQNDVRQKCPTCLLKVALKCVIRCAHCGHFIPAGGSVVLRPKRAEEPEYAMIYGDRAICCTRTECGYNGDFFSGYWNGRNLDLLFEGNTHVPRRNSDVREPIAANPQ